MQGIGERAGGGRESIDERAVGTVGAVAVSLRKRRRRVVGPVKNETVCRIDRSAEELGRV